jgi:hypothetical protein
MSGFTIACILGNNLKRKISDDHNEHQLHKRQTIEGNKIFNYLHFVFRFLIDHLKNFLFFF